MDIGRAGADRGRVRTDEKVTVTDVDVRGLPTDIEQRRRLGHDRRDEVWEGVYKVVPPGPHTAHGRVDAALARLLDAPAQHAGLVALTQCTLGERLDYRVPDGGYARGEPDAATSPPSRSSSRSCPTTTTPSPSSASTPPAACKRSWWPTPGAEPCAAGTSSMVCSSNRERSDLLGVVMADLTRDLPWPGRA